MNEDIHIVCLDAPSPPDYGGAIDMFCKIEALSKCGRAIHLHYFSYRPGRNAGALESLCASVHRYYRKSLPESFPFSEPYITGSRINQELIKRLNKDEYPVLLEGIHCAGLLSSLGKNRKAMVRVHNDEAVYYERLALAEKSRLKRLYFKREASLLHKFQASLPKETVLACLSQKDRSGFEKNYGFTQTHFIPSFVPWNEVNGPDGIGSYCLYHGNLLVAENEEAATWLIEKVFNDLGYPLVIAGKGISPALLRLAKGRPHIRFIVDPPKDELDILIRDAQIHVLPSLNETGVKLKLLHALFCGRHCISNADGVLGSGLEKFVLMAESPVEWKKAIRENMSLPYDEVKRVARSVLLTKLYDNNKNAERISALC